MWAWISNEFCFSSNKYMNFFDFSTEFVWSLRKDNNRITIILPSFSPFNSLEFTFRVILLGFWWMCTSLCVPDIDLKQLFTHHEWKILVWKPKLTLVVVFLFAVFDFLSYLHVLLFDSCSLLLLFLLVILSIVASVVVDHVADQELLMI